MDGGISWAAGRQHQLVRACALPHHTGLAQLAGLERSSNRTDGNADLGVRLDHWVIGAQEREGQVLSKHCTWCGGTSPLPTRVTLVCCRKVVAQRGLDLLDLLYQTPGLVIAHSRLLHQQSDIRLVSPHSSCHRFGLVSFASDYQTTNASQRRKTATMRNIESEQQPLATGPSCIEA